MNLEQIKSELFATLKHIKNNYNPNQPWLNPPESHARPNSEAAKSGRRADINGKPRSLKLSDMGQVLKCEKTFAASVLGISLVKVQGIYAGKGGTIFHNELERLMPAEMITPNREKASDHWNRSFVKLPSLGYYTTPEWTGKKTSGVWGQFDSYNPSWQTGIEFKSVPEIHTFPDEVPTKALIQGSLYMSAMKDKHIEVNYWNWLYLPLDLSRFIPSDITTYRVFFKDWEELEPLALKALEKGREVVSLLEWLQGDFSAAEPFLQCYDNECNYCNS